MTRINKYLALFMLERKDKLHNMLYKINDLKRLLVSTYPWAEGIVFEEVFEAFYTYYNTDVVLVDTMLHYIHIEDPTLRDKVSIFVGFYLNNRINFHTGLMTKTDIHTQEEQIKTLLSENNIFLDGMKICQTIKENNKNFTMQSIFISFLSIDECIDSKKIRILLKLFPSGYIEENALGF